MKKLNLELMKFDLLIIPLLNNCYNTLNSRDILGQIKKNEESKLKKKNNHRKINIKFAKPLQKFNVNVFITSSSLRLPIQN
jgi:hypothetical protein